MNTSTFGRKLHVYKEAGLQLGANVAAKRERTNPKWDSVAVATLSMRPAQKRDRGGDPGRGGGRGGERQHAMKQFHAPPRGGGKRGGRGGGIKTGSRKLPSDSGSSDESDMDEEERYGSGFFVSLPWRGRAAMPIVRTGRVIAVPACREMAEMAREMRRAARGGGSGESESEVRIAAPTARGLAMTANYAAS
jgi:hypothetical protein